MFTEPNNDSFKITENIEIDKQLSAKNVNKREFW